jgi:hypothetical protein
VAKRRQDTHSRQSRVGAHRDLLHGRHQFPERRAHTCREALAFVGQADAATRALDEPDTEVGLERLDLVTDRAVRHVQRFRRLGQAALARRRLERAQRLHRRKSVAISRP